MSKVKEYYDDLSRYLCYLLRHDPEGLHMDEYGYVSTMDLIEHVNTCSKFRIDEKMLRSIVKYDEKQRNRDTQLKIHLKVKLLNVIKVIPSLGLR